MNMFTYMVVLSFCMAIGSICGSLITKSSTSRTISSALEILFSCLMLTFITWLAYGE